MSCRVAAEQLLEVEENRKEGVYGADSLVVGVARLGQERGWMH